MTTKSRHWVVGQSTHDFLVTKAKEIPELQCELLELVHLPTGAQVMHLANDDPENLFCLSFRTLPDSSNGVAHILEHTVLCGSEKFPVKDPFFAMTRRSLNTFMNALTGSDFTCYPAATQVHKDFYNLLEVYLDAVFHPNLNELSFLQEGHRLEFATPSDPHSPLEHKGIVFNEMKGALTSGTARLAEAMNAALFPNLTYGYNSGGDPKDIPKLNYHELCAFHQQYYHPSRCLFFFYGNMPLEKHLDFIAQHALKDVKRQEPIPPLPMQPRHEKPVRLKVEYPISAEEDLADKAIISFGWLTCHILKQQEVLALSILEIILMDTDASPLKLALLKSGLCKQASANMDDDISEVPMIITLKGCEASDAEKLEAVVRQTLEEVVEKGIPLEAIENALHQLEFYRSEITGNHTPFGLSLFMRSALLKQHGGNPEDGLMIHTLFDQIHHRYLQEPTYFTDLIRKYFLDNPHFVAITMVPNKEVGKQELEAEKAELSRIRSQLAPGQIKQIIEKAADLIDFQKKQEEEDIDLLPKISLEDIPKFSRQFALTQEKLGELQVFHHSCFTNGIVYADLVFELPDIKEEQLPIVRFFASILAQMGCGGRTYVETLQYIQAHTGGVGGGLAFNLQVKDYNLFFPTFSIRGKALHRKADKLFILMKEMVESVDFKDIPRLKEVLLKHYTSLHSTLTQSALRYSINLSASALDVPSKIANAWHGLEYYWAIKQIAENIDSEIHPLSEKLYHFQKMLMGLKNPHLVLTCDNALYDKLKKQKFYGLQQMQTKPYTQWKGNYPLKKIGDQGRVIASPVAFTSQVFKTVSYINPDAPALSVAACLFDNLTLHPRIREQGGAYGGGAVNNTMSGNFYFYAYRDPNIYTTLKAFEESIANIAKGNFTKDDLEEAKLEVIQGLDAPVAPGSRGELAYSWMREGKTQEIRQAFRNRLLELTRDEVIRAVKAHIIPKHAKGALVVFAGKELLEKENALLASHHKNPLPLEPV